MRGTIGLVGRLVCLCMVSAGGGSTACGADKATGPAQLGCSDARWTSRSPPQISFILSCSEISVDLTGTGRDQFGRVLGYTYTYGCTDGSQSASGSVSNIQYNDLGEALGWDYSVNGHSCSHVTVTSQ
jgi:hypothetical protein